MNIFVPYYIAVALKELGFNNPCVAYYTMVTEKLCVTNSSSNNVEFELVTHNNLYKDYFLAPTWDQVFGFFREKYKLHSEPIRFIPQLEVYNYRIFDEKVKPISLESIILPSSALNTPKEAQIACVEKLIEIVKK